MKQTMKLKEIAITRRARKGAAHKITADGAYWHAVDIIINHRGGDGIGQSRARIRDHYRVRHYRNGSLRAYCETESWHQNYGNSSSQVRCDETLDCETVEDLIAAIKRVPLDLERSDAGNHTVYYEEILAKALPELPVALPAPDEANS